MKAPSKPYAILPALLLLAACATTGPRFESEAAPPEDRATVYLYRESGFVGSGVAYTVSANGVEIAALPAGGYFVYHAAPGEIEFTAKTEAKTSVTIDARAGAAYYIKGTIGVGFFVGHPHLTVVPNDVGAKEIAECNLVPGANTEGVVGPGGSVAKQGPFKTAHVIIAPVDIVGTVAVSGSDDLDVIDRRAKVVMERTTLGHTSMSGVTLEPGEVDLVRAIGRDRRHHSHAAGRRAATGGQGPRRQANACLADGVGDQGSGGCGPEDDREGQQPGVARDDAVGARGHPLGKLCPAARAPTRFPGSRGSVIDGHGQSAVTQRAGETSIRGGR